jgi:aminopeptidase N
MRPLTRIEARTRAAIVRVRSYRVDLDLTGDGPTFVSRSRVEFSCARPGSTTFVELSGADVRSARLNDRELDVSDGRLWLPDLAEHNVLDVTLRGRYSDNGQGLSRHRDPADGRTYVYSHGQVYDMHRVFACFDQPDLKAPVTFTVQVPPGWLVRGVAPAHEERPGRWRLDRTPPIPTYAMALVAGEFHEVRRDDAIVPMGLYCPVSLADRLDGDELFTLIGQCLAHFERLFGVPYPYAGYDHVFCPNFTPGAMENPGLVILRDDFLLPAGSGHDRRQFRALTIAHEMAHMWFGNLVTPSWWDDLWLSESFAELMAFHVIADATEFTTAWARFCAGRKEWGYRVDGRPSTHAILSPVDDTDAARNHLDGITYAKGAGVLKQLMARIGPEVFLAGLRKYFQRHAHGTASLSDLLSALGHETPDDLEAWADQWLSTSGTNTLTAQTVVANGRYTRVAIGQTTPLREHRVRLGLYDRDGGRLVRRHSLAVRAAEAETQVPALSGAVEADLLLLNDEDEAWARIGLDERSRRTLTHHLADLADPLARALCWQTLWDMAAAGLVAPGEYVEAALGALERETDPGLSTLALRRVRACIDEWGTATNRPERLRRLAVVCAQRLHQDQHLDTYIDCAPASDLVAWLSGGGPALTRARHWRILAQLAAFGRVDRGRIADELRRDATAGGQVGAALARVSLPSRFAKRAALRVLGSPPTVKPPILRVLAEGLFRPQQADLTRPLIPEALALIPRLWSLHGPWTAPHLAHYLLPRYHPEADTIAAIDEALASTTDPRPRRMLVDHRFDVERAIRLCELDGGDLTPRPSRPAGASVEGSPA